MSNTTAICPECGHRETYNVDGMSSRYELPCQGCGMLFTPRGPVDDVRQFNVAIRDALGRFGIRYHA